MYPFRYLRFCDAGKNKKVTDEYCLNPEQEKSQTAMEIFIPYIATPFKMISAVR